MQRELKIGRISAFVVLTGLMLATAGCATKDDGSNWPAVGAIEAPFDYRTIEEPWAAGDVAACKAYVPFSEATTTAAAKAATRRECLCDAGDACLEMMRQCDALEGCIEIRMCGIENNCNTANACYLFPGAKCVTTINHWGTSSVSAGLSTNMQTDCGCN